VVWPPEGVALLHAGRQLCAEGVPLSGTARSGPQREKKRGASLSSPCPSAQTLCVVDVRRCTCKLKFAWNAEFPALRPGRHQGWFRVLYIDHQQGTADARHYCCKHPVSLPCISFLGTPQKSCAVTQTEKDRHSACLVSHRQLGEVDVLRRPGEAAKNCLSTR